MGNDMNDESLYPHSPDVMERETADGGFSCGWGMHFTPVEKCIIDMHGHIQFNSFDNATSYFGRHMDLVRPLKITHCVACTPIMTQPRYLDEPQGFSVPCRSGFDELKPYFDLSHSVANLTLMLFLHYANPDVGLLRQSITAGACAVKLHNAPIIVNAADPEIWLSDEWEVVFAEIEKQELPVLWHVTQRLTDSPYTGGGRNTYWKDGWKKGVIFTNENLLQIFLKAVERHPGIPFISAHQLHVGWERMASMFSKYPNLYTDTSIGCVVNEGDRMHEDDIRFIRDIFIQHSDRILFGTDYFIAEAGAANPIGTDEEKVAIIRSHIRFIKQLRLPDEALQKIFHGNAERLLCKSDDRSGICRKSRRYLKGRGAMSPAFH
jgi:predicted TIM-barrel fold metal-dependent hydrolase